MNICLLTGEYPPLRGGVGDFSRALGRALADLGHHVHVLTDATGPAPTHADALEIHRGIGGWGWGLHTRVAAFAHTHKIDVVNVQYQTAAFGMHPAVNLLPRMLSARLAVIPTFHDLRVPYLFPKAGPLRKWVVRDMARSAPASIVTNAEDLAALSLAGARHVALVPIGSNVSLQPAAERASWLRARGLDPARCWIAYFGFMNESKGADSLLRAISLVAREADVGLLHIGEALGASDSTNVAYANKMVALARELGIAGRVAATGFLDDSGVSSAFAASDCVALPYRDGASYRRGTLMAALAHGAAIITTTPHMPLPQCKDGADLLYVPPDNPAALAAAILRVLREPALATRLRAGAQAASAHFGWPEIARDTAAVFAATLARREPDKIERTRHA